MFTSILRKMHLAPSPHDPCLFTGIVGNQDGASKIITSTPSPEKLLTSSVNAPKDTATPVAGRAPICVGVYVDDFVFYSTDPAEDELFETELAKHINVDFMGDMDYFLGTAFQWKRLDHGHISVHFTQTAFTKHTAHCFGVDRMNRVPAMTPYRSGLPIDSLAAADPNDPDLARRTKVYQGMVGSINWLATCTRPDISPCPTFLASYQQAPSYQHYKAVLHALKYLYSTSEYGIFYHSDASSTLHSFTHFPHHHDKEAYSDANPPHPPSAPNMHH